MFPPPPEAALPYRVDFSEIPFPYDYAWTNEFVVEEDLSFDWSTLQAPNGILDAGELPLFECPQFTAFYTSEAGAENIAESYQAALLAKRIPIPLAGYSDQVDLELCHLYFLRTSEGQSVAFLHIGWYVGGYDRHHFYWTYFDG